MRARLAAIMALTILAGCVTTSNTSSNVIPIDDFESGTLSNWSAAPNWRVDNNSAGGWYNGWQGKWFAWSGEGGEARTGKLRSKTFVLERDGVEVWIAGWADVQGRTADRWNYVTLNLKDGSELDRVYAPNAVTFTPKFLRGKGNKGKEVYIEAVDDAAEGSYSMLCLDNVVQRDGPKPLPVPKYRQRNVVRLENDLYRVEVSRGNGVITRILDKKAEIDLIREPSLAGNFKFTLPIRGEAAWQATEANYVLGDRQRLTGIKREKDSLELVWHGPLTSVLERKYDVDVTMRIALVADRIEFQLAVDNRTDYEIGELFYPMLGGIVGLVPNSSDFYVDPKQTVMVVPARSGAQSALVFQTFANQSWLGVIGPEQHYGYPDQLCMPWLDFYQKDINRGIYFGAIDPVVRYKVLHVEMLPGVAGPRSGGNWPTTKELRGLRAGLRVSVVHMPYSPPHTRFEATPVAVQAHAGDWRNAAHIHGMLAPLPTTPPEPSILLECDGRDWRRLPEQAKHAADAGLNGLLVRNWPDDSKEMLSKAIDECHKLGIKVILSMGIEPASQLLPSYDRLKDFACMDRWGILDTVTGWGPATTHVQNLAGVERRVILNPGTSGYRRILVQQTAALSSIGVDGIHLSRFFGRALDFNPSTGVTPDRATWEGGILTLAAMRDAGKKDNPQFLVLADDSFDQMGGCVDACGSGLVEQNPIENAYPQWRGLFRITDPTKPGSLNRASLERATIVLAPHEGADAISDGKWQGLLKRLRVKVPE